MVPVSRLLPFAAALCTSACTEKFSSVTMSPDGGPAAHSAEASTPSIPTNGMLLWMRAGEGITQQSGRVSRWDDQSASKMSATQDVASQMPLYLGDGFNGQPAVLFDGDDDALQFGSGFSDFSAGVSLFGVYERDNADICAAMLEASNGSEIDDISFGLSYGSLNYEVQENTEQGATYPADVPAQFSIVHRVDEAVEIRRDGLFGARGTFALPVTIERQAIYVGKSLYGGCPSFSGKIGEIIVYNRELAADEVRAVEQYQQERYGCCTQ
jgi:hypothetical protein